MRAGVDYGRTVITEAGSRQARNLGGSMINKLRIGVVAAAALALGSATRVGLVAVARDRRRGRDDRRRHPWSGVRPVLVGVQARRRRRGGADGGDGQLLGAGDVRHGRDGVADRCRRRHPARRARRVGARLPGAPGLARRGQRGGDPDHHGQLRVGQLPGHRGDHPRRPGRDDRRPGGGRTPCRSRGDERDVHQPGGRQRRARCPLRRRRRVDRGSGRHARGRAGRPQRPGRSAKHDQLDVAGRRHDRRDPRPRPDRSGTGAGRPRRARPHRATSCSARST